MSYELSDINLILIMQSLGRSKFILLSTGVNNHECKMFELKLVKTTKLYCNKKWTRFEQVYAIYSVKSFSATDVHYIHQQQPPVLRILDSSTVVTVKSGLKN